MKILGKKTLNVIVEGRTQNMSLVPEKRHLQKRCPEYLAQLEEEENENEKEREIERRMEEKAAKEGDAVEGEETKSPERKIQKKKERQKPSKRKEKNKRKRRRNNEESADEGERNENNEDRAEKEKREASLGRWHYDGIGNVIKYNREKEVEKEMLTFTEIKHKLESAKYAYAILEYPDYEKVKRITGNKV